MHVKLEPAPAVIVHGAADLAAALRPGLAVTVLSAPDAASYAGCGWWLALIAAARTAQDGRDFLDILDCGAAPGRALEAIRAGQRALVLDPACPGHAAIAAIAAREGLHLLGARPPALDLADPKARRRLMQWLTRHGDSPPPLG